MSYQKIPLLANAPFRLDVPGRVLLIDSPGAGGSVDVALVVNGTPTTTMAGRKSGFKNVAPFDGVILSSAVDTTVTLFLSFEDVNLGTNSLEIANTPANPVNVLFGGTVAPVLGTIANTDAQAIPVVQKVGAIFTVEQATEVDTRPYQAQAVTNVAPAAVTAAASVFLAAAVARRGFRIKNVGANPVAIGGAGLTFANAAVVIQSGETWNENEAPGAAWSAICDTGLASSLNIQTIA